MAPQHPQTGYEQIVFSGGGTRCFWQGGFMEVLGTLEDLTPSRICGVSGGALAGACWIAGRDRALLDRMTTAFARQEGNFPWHRKDRDQAITPHQRIYREVVEDVLDAEAQAKVAEGPSFQILLAHPPISWAEKAGAVLSTLLYEAELHLKGSTDSTWPEAAGLDSSLIDAREAARQGRLADLVAVAATIPPIFDLATWEGRSVIDGGMATQTPCPEPDEGRTLYLVTRHYDRLPGGPDAVIAEPGREVPADKIDFTDPEKIALSWELGQQDGHAFLRDISTNPD